MKTLFLIALVLWSAQSQAATNNAASASEADIRAAVNLCSNGDTVIIPQGSGNITNTIFILHNISIFGAGVGKTVLYYTVVQQGSNPRTLAMFDFEATNSALYRFSGIEYDLATNGYSSANPNQSGAIQFNGSCKSIRVDHCSSYHLNGRALVVQGCKGVVDHCSFQMNNQQACFVGNRYANGPSDLNGDWTWTQPILWGTTNAIYFEDDFFQDDRSTQGKNALDSQFGAFWVMRHCQFNNMNCGGHGTETGGRARGMLAYEFYTNSVYGSNNGLTVVMDVRSGSGVMFGNNVSGIDNHLARLDVNRSTDSFPLWGGANGFNGYDNNDPTGVFISGTHNGTNSATQLTDTTASWTPNQWFGYVVYNSNSTLFSVIVSNTANTIYYLGAKANLGISNPLYWTNGNVYAVRRVNDVLDQPGRGTCQILFSGNPASPVAWPSNAVAPLYSWNNTLGGGIDEIFSAFPNALVNREYFNSTPMPGYTPLVYPHPLVGGGGASPPIIISDPQNTTAVERSAATFQVVASGTPTLTYQWFFRDPSATPPFNPTAQAGATAATFTIQHVTPSMAGSYFVGVTNGSGSVLSADAILTVSPAAWWANDSSWSASGNFIIK